MPHKSEVPGKGHLCGHDGHSTILLGFARLIARQRPKRGRVVLLFQPAEENGAGAAAVLADPRFESIRPDWSFSLHNIPGLPLFHVSLAPGPVNCASRGLRIVLSGRTSHASTPEAGISPATALSQIIPGLMALGPGGPLTEDFKLATVVHAKLGEPAFGVAPGNAEIWVTLRAMTDDGMASLLAAAEDLARRKAIESFELRSMRKVWRTTTPCCRSVDQRISGCSAVFPNRRCSSSARERRIRWCTIRIMIFRIR
jgi:amidohydrolase